MYCGGPSTTRTLCALLGMTSGGKIEEYLMAHTRRYIKREMAQARAFSPAVITEGGRIVWLAGQTVIEDANGASLAGNFEGQVREIFARLGKTLAEADGKLADIVTMTVFITDTRYGDRFTELRRSEERRV